MLEIRRDFRIPDSELELSYARSSGPGGQNVNKVNSKAVLRWNALASAAIPPLARERLLLRLGPRLTREGEVILASDRYRDQPRNREDCLEKLGTLLRQALLVPKVRRETAPTRGSLRRDLKAKRHHAEKKRGRARPGHND